MKLIIKKATILCKESRYHLQVKDIAIENGVIIKIGSNIAPTNKEKVITEKNVFVSVGWMDLWCHFNDPGNEHKETIETGLAAAAKGGFTCVALLPNTSPTLSNKTNVAYVKNKSNHNLVTLQVLGAITKNIGGEQLAEMYDMQESGALAFTDGLENVQSTAILLKALQYVKKFSGIIIQHPVDKSLSKNTLMHEGIMSTQLGMPGEPSIAESIMLQRDIDLLKYTESKLHVANISCMESIALIKKAKQEKLNISCSVPLQNLIYNDSNLNTYNSNYKVQPPLRDANHQKALIKGIKEGIIDAISVCHLPQDWDNKNKEFEYCDYGMMMLETTLHFLMALEKKGITLEKSIACISNNARVVYGLPISIIEEGNTADITIFTTEGKNEYTEKSKLSKGINSTVLNQKIDGKILGVINNNKVQLF